MTSPSKVYSFVPMSNADPVNVYFDADTETFFTVAMTGGRVDTATTLSDCVKLAKKRLHRKPVELACAHMLGGDLYNIIVRGPDRRSKRERDYKITYVSTGNSTTLDAFENVYTPFSEEEVSAVRVLRLKQRELQEANRQLEQEVRNIVKGHHLGSLHAAYKNAQDAPKQEV